MTHKMIPDPMALFNPASIQQMLEQAGRDYEKARDNPEPMTRYLRQVTSLELWLEAAAAAEVTAVPANFSPTILKDDIESFFGYTGKGGLIQGTMAEALVWLETHRKKSGMWRWDACSGEELKYLMSQGWEAQRKDYADLFLSNEDSRAHELYFGIKPVATKLCVRPWITPIYHNGFPVEFRVFFPDGDTEGAAAVANYYIQRALGPEWEESARSCINLARRILKIYSDYNGRPEFGCTLDFMLIRTETGYSPIFLEAGPYPQASPCAFGSHNEIKDGAIALNALEA